MKHVYWLYPNLLAGRCGPTKKPWNPAELYAAGIRNIITVASNEPVKDPLEPYGFHHWRVPMRPYLIMWRGANKYVAQQSLPVLHFIHEQIKQNRPTLIHCHDGDDRTGIVLAGYLVIYEGLGVEEAIAHVRSIRPTAMKMPGYAATVRYIFR